MQLGCRMEDTQRTKHDVAEVYSELVKYLGDSLTLRLGCLPGQSIKHKAPKHVSLLRLVNGDSILARLSHRMGPGGDAARTASFITRLKYPNRPRLPSAGREGLRSRQVKPTRRGRSRSALFKEAFPLAKPCKIQKTEFTTMKFPGKVCQVRTRERTGSGEWGSPPVGGSDSAVWRINAKMPLYGKRRQLCQPRSTSVNHNHTASILGLNSLW